MGIEFMVLNVSPSGQHQYASGHALNRVKGALLKRKSLFVAKHAECGLDVGVSKGGEVGVGGEVGGGWRGGGGSVFMGTGEIGGWRR